MDEIKGLQQPSQEESIQYEVDATLQAKVRKVITYDFLKTIISAHNSALLNTTALSYDPTNIAHELESMSMEDLLFFFKSVNSDSSAEIFTYLSQDTKQRVIEAFNSNDIRELVDDMATDDLVDFVDELPANLMSKVLKSVSKEDSENVKAFLNLKKDTAGSLMTVEFLSIKETTTCKDALKKIKEVGKDCETIWKVFVIDDTKKLVGTINLDKLIESDENAILKDVMTNDFVAVSINTDQEVVLQAFRKYDTSVIPVVKTDNRMVGIITFDDILDVQVEEDQEDIMLQAGVIPTKKPYMQTSVFTLVRNYSLWLVILVVINTFTSMVLSRLQSIGPLLLVPVLVAILPSIMGTNGNSSDQTCTVTTRELALGNITTKDYFKMMWKEFRAATITAFVLAVFSFVWILVELYSGIISISENDLNIINTTYFQNKDSFFVSIAGLVSLTFLISTTISKLLGVSLPMLAKKCHLDPAIMAQPIVSTLLDIITIVIYFLLSLLIIKV